MRVLIAGASGFIGSAILARLRSEGYETLACVRSDRDSAPGDVQVIDFAAATTDDWLRILASIDAVVNCVGVLQDSTRDSTVCAHATGAARLFAACEKAGVQRVIHFSALGVDRPITKFSETKRYGDEALMQRQLDWVILRPSVVVGPAAYGGSALFRGLAGLPLLPRLPASGPLQIVQLSDVVETVFKLLQPNARSRMVLDLAGPERLSVWEVVALFRSWLGWKRQPSFVFAAAGGLVAVPARGFHWVARMATAIAFNGGCGDRPRRHRGRTRLGRIYRYRAARTVARASR